MGNIIEIIPTGTDRLPDMYNEGPTRDWTFRVSLQDVMDYVNAHTTKEDRQDEEKGYRRIYTGDDRDLLLNYLRGAVSNVSILLARRMPNPPEFNSDTVTFVLSVSDNYDDSMAGVLFARIMDYLCEYAYLKWVGGDIQKLSPMEDAIRRAIHYRKHGILRRVQNMNI